VRKSVFFDGTRSRGNDGPRIGEFPGADLVERVLYGIVHRDSQVAVPQRLRDLPDIMAAEKGGGGEGMTQPVRRRLAQPLGSFVLAPRIEGMRRFTQSALDDPILF